jgi:hypothetical protein
MEEMAVQVEAAEALIWATTNTTLPDTVDQTEVTAIHIPMRGPDRAQQPMRSAEMLPRLTPCCIPVAVAAAARHIRRAVELGEPAAAEPEDLLLPKRAKVDLLTLAAAVEAVIPTVLPETAAPAAPASASFDGGIKR